MKNFKRYLVYFIALNLIILGIDKFLKIFPLACTLMADASDNLLYGIGVAEIMLGILLLIGKAQKLILTFIILFMLFAVIMHLMQGTYDISAAVFFAILAAIPLFIDGPNSTKPAI